MKLFSICLFSDDIGRILRKLGLQMEIVLSRRSGAERLTVLKFTRLTGAV